MTAESSQPAVATSSDNTVFDLDRPRVLGATQPVVDADVGVSLVIYDLVIDGKGATAEVDPPLAGTVDPGDVIELWLVGDDALLDSQIIIDVNAITILRIPKGRLHADRVNVLFYTIRRGSQNIGTSNPLTLLYNKIRPGLKDTKPEVDGHSELALLLPDAIKNGVGPDFVSAQVCVSYPYCRAYDTITLKCNGEIMSHMVGQNEAPQPPNPGSPNPITVCFTVTRAYLESAVRPGGKLDFSYTVTDQLGNTPDTDAVWSASQTVDEDLAGTRLPAPILREIQNDPTDDPGIIDLEKLGNNPLLLIVLTSDPRFSSGDTLSATYTAKITGQPDVVVTVTGEVETDEFGQKKPCVLQVANDKVIAGSVVTVTYQLLKGDTPAGTSKVATARVVGEGSIELNPPTLPSTPNPFDPLNYTQGVSVRVDYAGAVPGHKARLYLVNPLPDSPAFVDQPLDQKFALFTLDAAFLGLWHGKVPQLAWKLIQGGQEVAESAPLVVTVNRIANDDPRLSKPMIDGAAGDGVLDVAQMQDSAQLRVTAWLLQVSLHCIWLRYDGVDKAGNPTEMVVWTGAAHGSTSGVTTAAAIAWLRTLKDGSKVTITFGVNFDKKADAATMVRFPVQVYTIQAVELVIPVIDTVTDTNDKEIPEAGITTSTTLKLVGRASKGKEVEIYDGSGASAVSKGKAPADATTGLWRLTITVTTGGRRLYAKSLYHSGDIYSNVCTLTVVVAVAPTIDSVKGNDVEVPNNTDTKSTSVSLQGKVTSGHQVQIYDGTTPKHTVSADGTTWTTTLAVALGSHSITAKALSTGEVSNTRSFRVISPVPPLTIDTSNLILNGQFTSLQGRLGDVRRTIYPPNTTAQRQASGGVLPVTYSSANPSIASVNSVNGTVISEANGTTRITVTDSSSPPQTLGYTVTVSNGYLAIVGPIITNWTQLAPWIASIGGIPIDPNNYSSHPVSSFSREYRSFGSSWGVVYSRGSGEKNTLYVNFYWKNEGSSIDWQGDVTHGQFPVAFRRM